MADFLKLTFSFKNNCVEHEAEVLFDFLATLYNNGQILTDYNLIKKDDTYHAFVSIPDKDALNPQFNTIYTNKYLNNIEFKIDYLGENVDISECCCCNQPSWYMLYTDFTSNGSPLLCGDCGHEIPLYKIQHIKSEKEHFGILSWQKIYKSVDKIWMYCLADRFTKRQLSDPNSQLSKDGMYICNELEKTLKKPVFYFLYQPNKIVHNCPKCGGLLKKVKYIKSTNFVCDSCKLALYIPNK